MHEENSLLNPKCVYQTSPTDVVLEISAFSVLKYLLGFYING